MSGAVAAAVVRWGVVLLRFLPEIIKVAQDLYALWCGMKGNQEENNAVLRAMKLLNRHHDDIDRLLQNPEERRALLEGLTILMRRINQHDASQAHGGDGDCGATFKPSKKGSNWKVCDVCYSNYNTSSRRPTILICGHTFCRACLEEMSRRRPLLCPTCRAPETRSLVALPPNTVLMSALDSDDQDEDSCCSGGGGGGGSGSSSVGGSDGCNGMPLSFEQQIEYAIFLSQQQAQSHGTAYVEASWHEVEEAEDERLALALQNSEIYEASRLCHRRQVDEATGCLDPPDKEGKKECSCGGSQAEPSAASTSREEDEEASLRLAIELHQQEVALSQGQCCSSCGGDSCASGESISCDDRWMKEYQDVLGSTFCGAVGERKEEDQEETQVEERSDKREEDDGDKDNGVCCSMNQEEERKEDTQDDKCGSKLSEDDCCNKKGKEECYALLKGEEELLIQMAIQLSLEQLEASQPPALTAEE